MLDKNLLLRDGTAALSASEPTPPAKDFGGQDLVPLVYQVDVPIAPTGTTPTLDCMLQGSNTSESAGFVDIAPIPQINAKGQFRKEIITPFRWRRMKTTLGGTTPSFGNVTISVHPAGLYDEK